MNQQFFWEFMDTCRYDMYPDRRLDELLDRLTALDVRKFDWIFKTLESYANRKDLFGAAHILGQASDEAKFMNFIRGLIAKGQYVFEAALRDPETLRCFWLGEPIDNEGIAWVACKVYARKMGISVFEAMEVFVGSDDDVRIELTVSGGPYVKPTVNGWDFDDEQENRKRLPKLSHAVYDHRYEANPSS